MKLIQLLAAATAIVLATHAQAQTSAPGPYYATPSWDQTLPMGSRFVVLTNMASQAFLDRETGLVWQRNVSTVPARRFRAIITCSLNSTGGRYGWRLPNLQELTSVFDANVQVQSIFENFPENALILSSTPHPLVGSNTSMAIKVSGLRLEGFSVGEDDPVHYICVRGGIGVSAH